MSGPRMGHPPRHGCLWRCRDSSPSPTPCGVLPKGARPCGAEACQPPGLAPGHSAETQCGDPRAPHRGQEGQPHCPGGRAPRPPPRRSSRSGLSRLTAPNPATPHTVGSEMATLPHVTRPPLPTLFLAAGPPPPHLASNPLSFQAEVLPLPTPAFLDCGPPAAQDSGPCSPGAPRATRLDTHGLEQEHPVTSTRKSRWRAGWAGSTGKGHLWGLGTVVRAHFPLHVLTLPAEAVTWPCRGGSPQGGTGGQQVSSQGPGPQGHRRPPQSRWQGLRPKPGAEATAGKNQHFPTALGGRGRPIDCRTMKKEPVAGVSRPS